MENKDIDPGRNKMNGNKHKMKNENESKGKLEENIPE